MINDALARVDFRQLDDDEEVLSNESPSSPRKSGTQYTTEFDTIDLQRIRHSTVHTNWRRIPSEVGCNGCEGCDRLCDENRRLRRQLDELEFELASAVLNTSDAFDPHEMVKAVPAMPQLPVTSKKKRGWTSILRNSTSASLTTSRPSERARLKSEVSALEVTTEYLWRKLNKAEIELRDYRLKELRTRMKTAGRGGKPAQPMKRMPTGPDTPTTDWEWE